MGGTRTTIILFSEIDTSESCDIIRYNIGSLLQSLGQDAALIVWKKHQLPLLLLEIYDVSHQSEQV